jgi:sialic acid synthase SpsE
MIISEIGINHMGDKKYAENILRDLLKIKDIDAITFQVREESFYYGSRKKLILSDDFYIKVKYLVKKANKKFGIALCDENKVKFFENLGIDFVKIINNDINNDLLLNKLLNSKIKKFYFSTGLSGTSEIKKLVKKIKIYKKKYEIIHTSLSHDINSINLNSIEYLKKITNLPVAFGLHSNIHEALLLSLSFFPSSVLFYVKGTKYKKHGDEEHALKISDLKKMVNIIKLYPNILGKFNKKKPIKVLDYK